MLFSIEEVWSQVLIRTNFWIHTKPSLESWRSNQWSLEYFKCPLGFLVCTRILGLTASLSRRVKSNVKFISPFLKLVLMSNCQSFQCQLLKHLHVHLYQQRLKTLAKWHTQTPCSSTHLLSAPLLVSQGSHTYFFPVSCVPSWSAEATAASEFLASSYPHLSILLLLLLLLL